MLSTVLSRDLAEQRYAHYKLACAARIRSKRRPNYQKNYQRSKKSFFANSSRVKLQVKTRGVAPPEPTYRADIKFRSYDETTREIYPSLLKPSEFKLNPEAPAFQPRQSSRSHLPRPRALIARPALPIIVESEASFYPPNETSQLIPKGSFRSLHFANAIAQLREDAYDSSSKELIPPSELTLIEDDAEIFETVHFDEPLEAAFFLNLNEFIRHPEDVPLSGLVVDELLPLKSFALKRHLEENRPQDYPSSLFVLEKIPSDIPSFDLAQHEDSFVPCNGVVRFEPVDLVSMILRPPPILAPKFTYQQGELHTILTKVWAQIATTASEMLTPLCPMDVPIDSNTIVSRFENKSLQPLATAIDGLEPHMMSDEDVAAMLKATKDFRSRAHFVRASERGITHNTPYNAPTPSTQAIIQDLGSSLYRCVQCNVQMCGIPSVDAHVVGLSHITKHFPIDEIDAEECPTCGPVANMKLHVITSAHRRAHYAERAKVYKLVLPTDVPISSGSDVQSTTPVIFDNGNQQFHCLHCSVHISGQNALEAHVIGIDHIKRHYPIVILSGDMCPSCGPVTNMLQHCLTNTHRKLYNIARAMDYRLCLPLNVHLSSGSDEEAEVHSVHIAQVHQADQPSSPDDTAAEVATDATLQHPVQHEEQQAPYGVAINIEHEPPMHVATSEQLLPGKVEPFSTSYKRGQAYSVVQPRDSVNVSKTIQTIAHATAAGLNTLAKTMPTPKSVAPPVPSKAPPAAVGSTPGTVVLKKRHRLTLHRAAKPLHHSNHPEKSLHRDQPLSGATSSALEEKEQAPNFLKRSIGSLLPASALAKVMDKTKASKEINIQLQKTDQLIDSVGATSTKINETVTKLSSAVDKISGFDIQALAEKFLKKTLGGIISSVADFTTIALDVATLVMDSYSHLSKASMAIRVTSVVIRVVKLLPVSSAIASIEEFLTSFFNKSSEEGEVVLSAGIDDIKSFFSSAYQLVVGKLPGSKEIKSYLRSAGDLGRNLTSSFNGLKCVTSAIDWIRDTLTGTYCWIAMKFKASMGIKWIDAITPCTKHADIIMEAYEFLNDPSKATTARGRDRLYRIRDNFERMKREWTMSLDGKSLPAFVHLLDGQIRDLAKAGAGCKVLSTEQVIPFGVFLAGGTQRGKSELASVMTSLLAPLADRSSTFLTMPERDIHLDRYDNHFALVFEEFAQVPENTPTQVEMMFKFLTTNRPQLRMAALEFKETDRGLLNIGGLFVNTNLLNPDFNSSDKGAFARRFYAYYVEFKDEYLTNTRDAGEGYPIPDMKKIQEYQETGCDTHELLVFRPYRLFDPDFSDISSISRVPGLSFSEWKAELAQKFKEQYVSRLPKMPLENVISSLVLNSRTVLTPAANLMAKILPENTWTMGKNTPTAGVEVITFDVIDNEVYFTADSEHVLVGATIVSSGGNFKVHSPPLPNSSTFTFHITCPAITRLSFSLYVSKFKDSLLTHVAPKASCLHAENACPYFSANPRCMANTRPFPDAPNSWSTMMQHANSRFTQFDVLTRRLAHSPSTASLNPFAKHPLLSDWFNRVVTTDALVVTNDWIYYCHYLASGMYDLPLIPPHFNFDATLSAGRSTKLPTAFDNIRLRSTYQETFFDVCEALKEDFSGYKDIAASWPSVMAVYGKMLPHKIPLDFKNYTLLNPAFDLEVLFECAKRNMWVSSVGVSSMYWTTTSIKTHTPPCCNVVPQLLSWDMPYQLRDKLRAFCCVKAGEADHDDSVKKAYDTLMIQLGDDIATCTPGVPPPVELIAPEILTSIWSPEYLSQFLDIHVDKTTSKNIYHCKLKELSVDVPDSVVYLLLAPFPVRQQFFSFAYGKHRTKWGSYKIVSSKSFTTVSEVVRPGRRFRPAIHNAVSKCVASSLRNLESLRERFVAFVKNHPILCAGITCAAVVLSAFGIYKFCSALGLSSGPPVSIRGEGPGRLNRTPAIIEDSVKELSADHKPTTEAIIWRFLAGGFGVLLGLGIANGAVELYRNIAAIRKERETPIPMNIFSSMEPANNDKTRFSLSDNASLKVPNVSLWKLTCDDYPDSDSDMSETSENTYVPSGFLPPSEPISQPHESIAEDRPIDMDQEISSHVLSSASHAPDTITTDSYRQLMAKLADNLVTLTHYPAGLDDPAPIRTVGIRVRDRYVITSAHLFTRKASNSILLAYTKNGALRTLVKMEKFPFSFFRGNDLACFMLPPNVTACKDITNRFQDQLLDPSGHPVKRNHVGKDVFTVGLTITPDGRDAVTTALPSTVHSYTAFPSSLALERVVNNVVVVVPTTSLRTKPGDCGSPVILPDANGFKIVGTHVYDATNTSGFNYADKTDVENLIQMIGDYHTRKLVNKDLKHLELSAYTLDPPTYIEPGTRVVKSLLIPEELPIPTTHVAPSAIKDFNYENGPQLVHGCIQQLGHTKAAPSSNNDLIRSFIDSHPDMPLSQEPAMLSENTPDWKCMSKANVIDTPIFFSEICQSTLYLAHRDCKLKANYPKSFCDFDQLLNARVTNQQTGEIIPTGETRPTPTSSATFPWNKLPGITQLKHMVVADPKTGITQYKPFIQTEMEYATIEQLKQWSNGHVGTYCGGFLKSEKRPLKPGQPNTRDYECKYCNNEHSHVKVDNPRVVGCPTKAHSHALAFLFRWWASARVQNRHNIANQIGIDPMTDWTFLGNKLIEHPYFHDADGDGFDKTMGVATTKPLAVSGHFAMFSPTSTTEDGNRFLNEILPTLSEQSHLMLDAASQGKFSLFEQGKISYRELWLQMQTTYGSAAASIVTMYTGIGSHLYWLGCALTSGVFVTGDSNGATLESIMFEAVRRLTGDTFEQIEKNFRIFAYGDDSAISTSYKFTLQQLIDTASKLGVRFTPGNKGAITKAHSSFHEITFLKRAWYRDPNTPNYFRCPLQIDVIDNMWYWYRKSLGPATGVRVAVDAMIREYAQHPDDVFFQRTAAVSSHMKEHGINMHIPLPHEVRAGSRPTFNGRFAAEISFKDY